MCLNNSSRMLVGVRSPILILVCCLVVAGCSGAGSHAASTPSTTYRPKPFTNKVDSLDILLVPSNHGGFVGAAQLAYDGAYVRCYTAARAAMANGSPLTTATVAGGGAHATNKGCHDGVSVATQQP
jgi:hypothetical protein